MRCLEYVTCICGGWCIDAAGRRQSVRGWQVMLGKPSHERATKQGASSAQCQHATHQLNMVWPRGLYMVCPSRHKELCTTDVKQQQKLTTLWPPSYMACPSSACFAVSAVRTSGYCMGRGRWNPTSQEVNVKNSIQRWQRLLHSIAPHHGGRQQLGGSSRAAA